MIELIILIKYENSEYILIEDFIANFRKLYFKAKYLKR